MFNLINNYKKLFLLSLKNSLEENLGWPYKENTQEDKKEWSDFWKLLKQHMFDKEQSYLSKETKDSLKELDTFLKQGKEGKEKQDIEQKQLDILQKQEKAQERLKQSKNYNENIKKPYIDNLISLLIQENKIISNNDVIPLTKEIEKTKFQKLNIYFTKENIKKIVDSVNNIVNEKNLG